jgi:hypothetical protein
MFDFRRANASRESTVRSISAVAFRAVQPTISVEGASRTVANQADGMDETVAEMWWRSTALPPHFVELMRRIC